MKTQTAKQANQAKQTKMLRDWYTAKQPNQRRATIQKLANAVGRSEQTVYKWMTGEIFIRRVYWARINRVTKLTIF